MIKIKIKSFQSEAKAGVSDFLEPRETIRVMEDEICEQCGEIHDHDIEVGLAQDIDDKTIKIHINEVLEIDEDILFEKKDRCYYQAKRKYKVFPSAYASGYIVRCRKGKVGKKKKKNESIDEGTFDKEKSKGLHGWFSRQGGKGKSKGWVDCNTCRTNPKTGRKTCKSCGRKDAEKRGKYPACRPTPSACNKKGTSKKKSSKRVSWKKED